MPRIGINPHIAYAWFFFPIKLFFYHIFVINSLPTFQKRNTYLAINQWLIRIVPFVFRFVVEIFRHMFSHFGNFQTVKTENEAMEIVFNVKSFFMQIKKKCLFGWYMKMMKINYTNF